MTAFLAAFILKMAFVAGIVVGAASLAERTRPAIAALVATLPISIGPAYLILAIDHDAAFLTAAALKSAASVGATLAFVMTYANALPKFRPLPALACGYLIWLPAAAFVHHHAWSVTEALAFVGLATLAGTVATRHLKAYRPESIPPRRWWDVPLRAACVMALVGAITLLSDPLGPSGSGTLANFPIVMTSVSLIAHLRMGGRAAAAVLANANGGLLGVSLALVVVHYAIPAIGTALSLLTGLIFCILWNLGIFLRGR